MGGSTTASRPGPSGGPARERATASRPDPQVGHWHWRGWAPVPIGAAALVVATLAVVVDVATAWLDVELGRVGWVPLSPALPLGIALFLLVGPARLGFSRPALLAWRGFLSGVGVVLVYAAVSYAVHVGTVADAAGLVLAAVGEELVYRLAVLLVAGALAARLMGRDWRSPARWGTGPGVAALVAAGLVFTLLPGHVAQMRDPETIVPFASLGVVLGYSFLRTGSLVPAMLVHALLNLATIASFAGEMAPAGRVALALAALVSLVAGTTVAGQRLGLLRRVPAAIDLREGHEPVGDRPGVDAAAADADDEPVIDLRDPTAALLDAAVDIAPR